jgi:hypothetical protein
MWNNRRRAGIEAGMLVHQDGDWEGSMVFDPSNPSQAKLAIQIAGLKRKRVMSDAQKKALSKARSLLPARDNVHHPRTT